jgi:hypothetical protein
LATLLAAHSPYDGAFELRLPGLWVVRRSRPDREMVRGTVPPAFCVVAHGAKVVMLGSEVFSYDASRMFAYAVDLPIAGQVMRASVPACASRSSPSCSGSIRIGENARVGAYCMPFAQSPTRGIRWAIRTSGDVNSTTLAVQRALAEVDPDVPLTDVVAMSARVEKSLNPRRAPMLLALGFGAVALLLASVGLYGVLSYHVGQRTPEFGIRMALGSDARGIRRLIRAR